MAGIKQEVVDEILMRTDIQDLISSYVTLKRAASNFKGLCPFHSEKSPSFTVYPASDSFYCFGCGMGGNAITFVREIEHLDYPDAIEFLAKRAGVTVIRDERSYNPQKKAFSRERMWEMNKAAAKFFHQNLMAQTPASQSALSYFTNTRKLELSTVKHFGLGYAPDDFSAFSNHMIAKGFTYDELVAGFLCGKSESGKYYDAFRNRVMFPIIDVTGNIIAFGGRAMDNETKPKYKNSSDTPVFKKSRNLFALNFARHSCKEEIILCEGYMDVIALHSAGFENSVATLGTAITDEQARLLSKYTKRVIICYDADEAGQKAAVRALNILEQVGLETKVISIPGSKDPDEYIKTFGKDKFNDVIKGAKTKFDYAMENILKQYDINLPSDLVKALERLENEISGYYSAAEREIYCGIVAKKFNLNVVNITNDVERIRSKRIHSFKKNESESARRTLAGYGDKINPDFAKAPSVAKHEEFVLGLLLIYPEHRKLVFDESALTDEDFFTDFGKRVFGYIKSSYENDDVFSDVNEIFTPEEVGRIYKMKLTRMALDDNSEKVLREGIDALKSSMRKKSAGTVDTLDGLSSFINKLRQDT